MTQRFLDRLNEILKDTKSLLNFAYENIGSNGDQGAQENLDEIFDRLEAFEKLLKVELQK